MHLGGVTGHKPLQKTCDFGASQLSQNILTGQIAKSDDRLSGCLFLSWTFLPKMHWKNLGFRFMDSFTTSDS